MMLYYYTLEKWREMVGLLILGLRIQKTEGSYLENLRRELGILNSNIGKLKLDMVFFLNQSFSIHVFLDC